MTAMKKQRALFAIVALAIAVVVMLRVAPRAASLPLVTRVDGPDPARATGVVVFLHGRGGSVSRVEWIVAQLRAAGLPADYAVVLLEGPYSTGFGHQWGHSAEEQASSRARIRARLGELFADGGPPRGRVTIAGFSQGAGVAIDTAVEDARVGAVAGFSPCLSWLRGELPKKQGLRILLAHGRSDAVCPVEESRSLARALEAAHVPARYLEVEGGHVVPPDAVRALVELATAP